MVINITLLIVIGIITGYLTMRLFNILPVSWLTDYNESPNEKHAGKRIRFCPEGIVTSIIFCIVSVLLFISFGLSPYIIISYITVVALVIIAISDIKYTIIPDQFVVLVGILAVIFILYDLLMHKNIYHTSYLSPIIGAVFGGGIIYLIGLIGKLLFKKDEAMGFGDVKLLFVAGLYFGSPGIFIVLLMTILISGIYFSTLIIAKKTQKDENKALGPHIVVACILYITFYPQINRLIQAYMNLMIM